MHKRYEIKRIKQKHKLKVKSRKEKKVKDDKNKKKWTKNQKKNFRLQFVIHGENKD